MNLQRGKSNNREHLTHIEWKNKRIREENIEIEKEIEQKQIVKNELEANILSKKDILKPELTIDDLKEKRFFGSHWNIEKVEKLISNIKILSSENETLIKKITEEVPNEKEKIKREYEKQLQEQKIRENRLLNMIQQMEKEREAYDNEQKEKISILNHLLLNGERERIERYIDKKKEQAKTMLFSRIEEILRNREISVPTDTDFVIREVMNKIDEKSNPWELLEKFFGEKFQYEFAEEARKKNEQKVQELKQQREIEQQEIQQYKTRRR